MVGRVMKPHRLDVSGRGQRLAARMHHVPLGDVSLSRLHYGAEVDIVPGPLEDFFLVQMPLAGRAQIECGAQCIDSGPQLASVLSAADATTMRWGADNDSLMVRISRALIERTLAVQLGRTLDKPLCFELGFRWRDNAAWINLLQFLLEGAAQTPDLARYPLITSHLEQLIAATLLSVQPHNYSQAAPARCGNVLPRHVRKVQEYLQAHAHEPIHAEQLAQVAGVSPMQFLKNLRLERARAELQAGASSVAAVALRWGFVHLGRFSAEYRARFGESPSDTRRHH
ncbi:MAG: AraC family transcriptional regulator [Burkholderiales bacterium]|nr:AraC family transcriptional regulator [Burkholderiales bacterium]